MKDGQNEVYHYIFTFLQKGIAKMYETGSGICPTDCPPTHIPPTYSAHSFAFSSRSALHVFVKDAHQAFFQPMLIGVMAMK
jgi:hypothetical protein